MEIMKESQKKLGQAGNVADIEVMQKKTENFSRTTRIKVTAWDTKQWMVEQQKIFAKIVHFSTKLSAREHFTEFCRRENFKICSSFL